MENLFNQPAEINLPPVGHERREELLKRDDALAEQGETQYADRGTIPADVLQPDHNVQNVIRRSHLDIGSEHPLYKTKWVNYVNMNGQMVWQAKADGWAVASGKEFPEADDMAKVDGSIRIGDVILMFIRHDEHFHLEQREATKRLRQQYGVEAEIHDLAAKHGNVFKNVHTPEITGGMPDGLLKTVEARAARRSSAVSTAARHLGNKMKTGTIPGVPIT